MQRLIIITGASRGIGECIALVTNRKFNQGDTLFLLIARDQQRLAELKEQMRQDSDGSSRVLTLKVDFSSAMKSDEMADRIAAALCGQEFLELKELYVFYNHGTLQLASVEELADQAAVEFQTNVVSVWTVLAAVRQLFAVERVPKQFHVNTSSLLATQLAKKFAAYSSTRCARAAIFGCLALEQPLLRCLNYQPGPVYTDMLRQIFQDAASNEIMYPEFKDHYNAGTLLKAETTVQRLWQILDKNTFRNGSTVDYYDAI